METTVLSQTGKPSDRDSLILASLIRSSVDRTIAGVHSIVVLLLQYALLGASITNNLIDLTVTTVPEAN